MRSFLLVWNPKYNSWPDFSSAVSDINQELDYEIFWAFKSTRKVEVGDKFFLMKLGGKGNGLVGSGSIISKSYNLPHWDEVKAAEGKILPRVDLKFNTLSDEPFITADYLKKEFDSYNWFPQNSGIEIPEEIAKKLESLWVEKTGMTFVENSKVEPKKLEGASKYRTVKTYERNAEARQKCIDKGCEYEVDPEKDLRPVCANCHAMLHRKRPAYSIEDIKIMISKK